MVVFKHNIHPILHHCYLGVHGICSCPLKATCLHSACALSHHTHQIWDNRKSSLLHLSKVCWQVDHIKYRGTLFPLWLHMTVKTGHCSFSKNSQLVYQVIRWTTAALGCDPGFQYLQKFGTLMCPLLKIGADWAYQIICSFPIFHIDCEGIIKSVNGGKIKSRRENFIFKGRRDFSWWKNVL